MFLEVNSFMEQSGL